MFMRKILTGSLAFRFLFIAASLLSGSLSSASEINVKLEKACATSGVTIQGPIVKGDFARFQTATSTLFSRFGKENCERGFTFVWLHSEGGDVAESIRLGREIRAHSFGTFVKDEASCLSSCVFILAAGVSRITGGNIGIHRPYFNALPAASSLFEIRQKRDSLNDEIRSYLKEIDVPTSLLDEMLSVAPEEIRILSDSELRRFRLTGVDPTFDELKTAKNAAFYGMKSSEFRVALAESIEKCPFDKDFSACQTASILKISLAEAKRRQARSQGRCEINDERQRLDCYRSFIVLGK